MPRRHHIPRLWLMLLVHLPMMRFFVLFPQRCTASSPTSSPYVAVPPGQACASPAHVIVDVAQCLAAARALNLVSMTTDPTTVKVRRTASFVRGCSFNHATESVYFALAAGATMLSPRADAPLCLVSPNVTNCSDGYRNGDEVGVDCGGSGCRADPTTTTTNADATCCGNGHFDVDANEWATDCGPGCLAGCGFYLRLDATAFGRQRCRNATAGTYSFIRDAQQCVNAARAAYATDDAGTTLSVADVEVCVARRWSGGWLVQVWLVCCAFPH